MNIGYVWTRIYPFSRESFAAGYQKRRLENVCGWVVRAHEEKHLCRSGISNLIRRISKDYGEDWEHWIFISESKDYEDFKKNLPDYTKIRKKFPSRDKQPIEEICFPWSNEHLYGKGINSRVRDRDV